MKCPNDQSEMEQGAISHANTWLKNDGNIVRQFDRKLTNIISKSPWVIAWKCPNCGKIELTSEVDK